MNGFFPQEKKAQGKESIYLDKIKLKKTKKSYAKQIKLLPKGELDTSSFFAVFQYNQYGSFLCETVVTATTDLSESVLFPSVTVSRVLFYPRHFVTQCMSFVSRYLTKVMSGFWFL